MKENESSDSLSELRLTGDVNGDLGERGVLGNVTSFCCNLALSFGDVGGAVFLTLVTDVATLLSVAVATVSVAVLAVLLLSDSNVSL